MYGEIVTLLRNRRTFFEIFSFSLRGRGKPLPYKFRGTFYIFPQSYTPASVNLFFSDAVLLDLAHETLQRVDHMGADVAADED